MRIKEKSDIERIIGETIKSVDLGRNGKKNVEITCQSGVVFLLEPEYPEGTKVTSFIDSVETLVGFVVKDACENGYYVDSLTGTEDHTLYEIETEKGLSRIELCGFLS